MKVVQVSLIVGWFLNSSSFKIYKLIFGMLVEFDNLNTSVQLLADLVLVYKSYWQLYAVISVRVDLFDLKKCYLIENIARISEMAFFFCIFISF